MRRRCGVPPLNSTVSFRPDPMRIRTARIEEAADLRTMIMEAVLPHKDEDFSDEGWLRFQEPNTIPLITDRLLDARVLTLVCEMEGALVGIITVKDHAKIDQLFVIPRYRRQGVAKALWEEALRLCKTHHGASQFSVLSSTMGVPMYRAFGFHLVGPKQTVKGITFYPMAWPTQSEANISLERQ